MRFCSLNTIRSLFFQEMVSHLSIGALAAVFIASALLLAPLPSTLPCLCQHVSWLSHERWLLRSPLPSGMRFDTCSTLWCGEPLGSYSVPGGRLGLHVGSHWSPGYFWDATWIKGRVVQ